MTWDSCSLSLVLHARHLAASARQGQCTAVPGVNSRIRLEEQAGVRGAVQAVRTFIESIDKPAASHSAQSVARVSCAPDPQRTLLSHFGCTGRAHAHSAFIRQDGSRWPVSTGGRRAQSDRVPHEAARGSSPPCEYHSCQKPRRTLVKQADCSSWCHAHAGPTRCATGAAGCPQHVPLPCSGGVWRRSLWPCTSLSTINHLPASTTIGGC